MIAHYHNSPFTATIMFATYYALDKGKQGIPLEVLNYDMPEQNTIPIQINTNDNGTNGTRANT